MNCSMCACYSCSQQDNCASCGCDGGGCTSENLDYFVSECDDYEVDPYSEPEEYDWDDDDE